MIKLTEYAESSDPDVEFDEYVPVTATWPEATEFLQPPVYVRCVEKHRLLELKFNPSTRNLVELVLVNAPGLEIEHRKLSGIQDAAVRARWTGNASGGEFDRLTVTALEDFLLMNFSADLAVRWIGQGAVVLGTTESGSVGAIAVRWKTSERKAVLG